MFLRRQVYNKLQRKQPCGRGLHSAVLRKGTALRRPRKGTALRRPGRCAEEEAHDVKSIARQSARHQQGNCLDLFLALEQGEAEVG